MMSIKLPMTVQIETDRGSMELVYLPAGTIVDDFLTIKYVGVGEAPKGSRLARIDDQVCA